MKLFKRNEQTPDPRDMVGQNPTGRERRSSSRSRRKAANNLERDLQGTVHESTDETAGEES